MTDDHKTDNHDAEWNRRNENKPIIQWLLLIIVLALLAYVAAGA